MDQFTPFYGEKKKKSSKTSLDRLKLTYKTKKKRKKKFLMSRLEPLWRTTMASTLGPYRPRKDILYVPPIPQQIQISVDQPYAGPAASCCGIIGTYSISKDIIFVYFIF
jgi:hypothetical protein